MDWLAKQAVSNAQTSWHRQSCLCCGGHAGAAGPREQGPVRALKPNTTTKPCEPRASASGGRYALLRVGSGGVAPLARACGSDWVGRFAFPNGLNEPRPPLAYARGSVGSVVVIRLSARSRPAWWKWPTSGPFRLILYAKRSARSGSSCMRQDRGLTAPGSAAMISARTDISAVLQARVSIRAGDK
jgi:hypothetical protein